MQMYFSPSTRWFYCRELHGDNMPADVTPISDALYQVVKGRAVDVVDGLPVLAAPKAVIPSRITMRQARLALLGAGKLSGVDAAIAALPSPQKEAAQIEWDYAAVVERESALVSILAASVNLTGAELDALFTHAADL